ncbi:MAG: hypothetical protein M3O34_00110 [Chloroflexota bacterium]|nr:hypothetical protein [Chloroflexota bacterium]
MTVKQDVAIGGLDGPMLRAIEELRATISEKYPTATFEISRHPEEPENVLLKATLDLEDPDEVLELVGDRLFELQVVERIAIYVIPLHTPERVLADIQARENARCRRSGASSDSTDQRPRRAASHTPTVSPRR